VLQVNGFHHPHSQAGGFHLQALRPQSLCAVKIYGGYYFPYWLYRFTDDNTLTMPSWWQCIEKRGEIEKLIG
jgi:hypothetical protein